MEIDCLNSFLFRKIVLNQNIKFLFLQKNLEAFYLLVVVTQKYHGR